MAKRKFRLTDLEALEVSLVDQGANKKKFLLLKNDGEKGEHMSMYEILKTELKDEKKISEILKQNNLSPEQMKSIRGALRLLESVKGVVPDTVFQQLSDMGYGMPEKENQSYGYSPQYGYPPMRAFSKNRGEDEMGKTNTDQTNEPTKTPEGNPTKQETANVEGNSAGNQTQTKSETKTVGKNEVLKEMDFDKLPDDVKPSVEAIWKSQKEALAKAEKLEKELKSERDQRLQKQFIEKASEFQNLNVETDKFGKILKNLYEKDTDLYNEISEILKSADAAIGESKLYQEVGTDSGESAGASNAWDKIEKLAKSVIQKADKPITHAEAISEVLNTMEGSKLYQEYKEAC